MSGLGPVRARRRARSEAKSLEKEEEKVGVLCEEHDGHVPPYGPGTSHEMRPEAEDFSTDYTDTDR